MPPTPPHPTQAPSSNESSNGGCSHDAPTACHVQPAGPESHQSLRAHTRDTGTHREGARIRAAFGFKRKRELRYRQLAKKARKLPFFFLVVFCYIEETNLSAHNRSQLTSPFPSERRTKPAVKSFLIWPNSVFVSAAVNANLLGLSRTNKRFHQLLKKKKPPREPLLFPRIGLPGSLAANTRVNSSADA